MKSRVLLSVVLVTTVCVACSGSGAGKAEERKDAVRKDTGPNAVLGRMAGIAETMATSMEKAESAAAVAAAFDGYSDAMEKLIPEIKAVLEKHPALKGKIGRATSVEAPAEYKANLDRYNAAMGRVFEAFMGQKAEPYHRDEAVQKAQQRVSAIVDGME